MIANKATKGGEYILTHDGEKQNGGVEKRAGTINTEYQKKMQTADKRTRTGDREADGTVRRKVPGPVEQRLSEFGQSALAESGAPEEGLEGHGWLINQMAKV